MDGSVVDKDTFSLQILKIILNFISAHFYALIFEAI